MTQPNNLAAALAAFQAEMPTVKKSQKAEVPTKSGGKYTYTYADLSDVTEAAMPLLAKHGLSFTCKPQGSERGYELTGELLHTSGESKEGTLPIGGHSPQEIGSSLTYMRRYLLGCLTGVVTDDDDDGALASQKQTQAQRPRTQSNAGASEKQLGMIGSLMSDQGMTDKPSVLAYVADVIGRQVQSRNELTKAEASKLIERLQADAPKAERLATTPSDDPWQTEGTAK